MLVPSSFILCVPGVSQYPVPHRAVVMRSPLILNIIAFRSDSFSHLRLLPAARPGCLVPTVVEGWHSGDSLHYPIQWVRLQGLDHLRVNPGFSVFWFIAPLLVVAYLQSTSFIWRISSGLSRVGVSLFQIGQSALDWPLRSVLVWKLSRTYPGEKLPSLSLPKQGCCFATRHLLAIPKIPVRMRALYESLMIRSAPPAHEIWLHYSQEN